jgi:hypothetical protein
MILFDEAMNAGWRFKQSSRATVPLEFPKEGSLRGGEAGCCMPVAQAPRMSRPEVFGTRLEKTVGTMTWTVPVFLEAIFVENYAAILSSSRVA